MNQYPSNAEYNKLVRDRIPEIIAADGLKIETRELENEEVVRELFRKVVEEATELTGAENREDIVKEMADVFETIYSLAERLDVKVEEIEEVRKLRAEKRGRFEKGIYLVRTYKEL